MRKLASIQYIHDVTPIKDADRIELAHVLGWQCVVPKGEFKPGDLGVYFEIDSFLPIEDRYEFLRKSSYRKSEIMGEGLYIRTQKMRGEISQGLLLPLSTFPEITPDMALIDKDVTDLLHVRKWEIEERATDQGTIISQLPTGVPKTDETRVQSEAELIHELGKQPYYITTKMDGSSHSVFVDEDDEIHVTGHNYEYADDDKCSFYKYLKSKDFINGIRQYKIDNGFATLTIQGEFCAPGIQGNPVKLTKPEWYVFTLMIDGKRMDMPKLVEICDDIGLTTVPIEEEGTDFDHKYPTVDDVLARADQSMYSKGVKAEGIVIRPIESVYSPTIGTYLSMKAVSNKYLLKKKA
jgi:RNA ligase (TIGR02306 family)